MGSHWAHHEIAQGQLNPDRAACYNEVIMVRLLVLYGHPKDPAAFDRYYRERHLPIARRMKGLKKWTIGKVQGTADGSPSPYYYIADLYAENRKAFDEILSSPEGKAAVADVPNYASGGVTFIYTEVEEII
jgi:uncharacterized protein (TIGR02118 family)